MEVCHIQKAALDAPEQIAWISPSQKISFMQLHRDVTDKMDELHKQGLSAGGTIGIATPNLYEVICSLFATWRLRASLAIFNPQLPPHALQNFFAQLKTPHTPYFSSLLLATSGSTQEPKIAILSQKSLFVNATHSVTLTREDRWLLSLPLHHVSGIGIVLRCVLARAAIVVDKAHRDISHLSFVPTQLYRESPVYPKLKCVLVGGAPIPLNLTKKLPLHLTYGLTEMGSMVLTSKEPRYLKGLWFLGHPLPGREMRLATDGEIWVRGSSRFTGYLNAPPLPLDAWFPTKDIGSFNAKEGFAIIGRKDWQFISGGENIQPEEIEQALLQIPGVLEAVVVPQKNPEYGMHPIALVQSLQKDLSLSQITEYLSSIFPKYKIPKQLHLVETFPRKGNKIDRKKIILNYLK